MHVLNASREQTELVAFGVAEDDPADVVVLPHVGALCAESKEPPELLGRAHAVSARVEMQPVLHRLAFGHYQYIDRWPGPVKRGDADPVGVLLDDLPPQDGTPEVGDHSRPYGVEGDDS